jgi:hypothetical protein
MESSSWSPGIRLFVLSFTALFLELMVIRWVPSEVRLVAYYANLMLVSSFLGLGIGALVGSRGWGLFRWFSPLFAGNILLLLWLGNDLLPGGGFGEFRFGAVHSGLRGYLSLLLIFFGNAAMFAPLGEAIGLQFSRLPTLRAYSWDLAGSLSGTLVFGLFSLQSFSPVLGLSAVVMIVLALSERRHRWWSTLACGAAVSALWLTTARPDVFWSPYYCITVSETYLKTETPAQGPSFGRVSDRPAESPPAGLRTMRDPPIYNLRVNQDFYQMHGTVDLRRYSEDGWRHAIIVPSYAQYSLPYELINPPARVLVLGAGGGMDVETALLHGAKRVDAVEIDPLIPVISNRISAAAPYRDPRVTLHIDDGRAFLQRCTDKYDLVAFGYLDSQALFSYGASLRLDGYIHTVESFRKAFEKVREGGAMVVWFYVGYDWLAQKLVQMIAQATGGRPYVYVKGATLAIVAPKGPLPRPPSKETSGWELTVAPDTRVDLATDDWPYLYLERQGIPTDYAVVIGLLLAISIIAVASLRSTSFGATDGHFIFLGWGFLLLQTKSIGDCSLYFGTTWLVTTLVITGVLLMVLLANWIALRHVRAFSPWLFVPLFLSLLILLAVPKETILAQTLGLRLAWTLLAVPLPVFFAGLIFSTTFRGASNPSALFGANLIGATIGGFCEYLGMWIGSHLLGYVVLAAYAASLTCLVWQRRGSRGSELTAPA